MNKTFITSVLTPFLLSLSACGGGGGNGSDTINPAPTTLDTTAPVITLIGNSTVTIEAGTSYSDDSATANDNKDGDITSKIAVNNPVDTNSIGSYTVTYNVSDTAGNAANQVTRIVNVVDTVAPVIILNGDSEISIALGSEYSDDGATAVDLFEGSLTPTASSTVDINTEGSYTVTYTVSDASGNIANPITRTVHVKDTLDSSLLPPQVPNL